MVENEHDPVTQPNHYNWIPGVECKDVVQHFNFMIGAAMKYLWRVDHKGNPIQDLEKARECITNEIKRRRALEQKTTAEMLFGRLVDGVTHSSARTLSTTTANPGGLF